MPVVSPGPSLGTLHHVNLLRSETTANQKGHQEVDQSGENPLEQGDITDIPSSTSEAQTLNPLHHYATYTPHLIQTENFAQPQTSSSEDVVESTPHPIASNTAPPQKHVNQESVAAFPSSPIQSQSHLTPEPQTREVKIRKAKERHKNRIEAALIEKDVTQLKKLLTLELGEQMAEQGMTIWHLAVGKYNSAKAIELLAGKVESDPNAQGIAGVTPLHLAATIVGTLDHDGQRTNLDVITAFLKIDGIKTTLLQANGQTATEILMQRASQLEQHRTTTQAEYKLVLEALNLLKNFAGQ